MCWTNDRVMLGQFLEKAPPSNFWRHKLAQNFRNILSFYKIMITIKSIGTKYLDPSYATVKEHHSWRPLLFLFTQLHNKKPLIFSKNKNIELRYDLILSHLENMYTCSYTGYRKSKIAKKIFVCPLRIFQPEEHHEKLFFLQKICPLLFYNFKLLRKVPISDVHSRHLFLLSVYTLCIWSNPSAHNIYII